MPKKTPATDADVLFRAGQKIVDAARENAAALQVALSPSAKPEPTADLGDIIKRIAEMSECRLKYIAIALDVVERDRGSSTPAEDFIHSLLHGYVYKLTPQMVEQPLETFRRDFDSMKEEAGDFVARYPELYK